jgi:hypothetical protein
MNLKELRDMVGSIIDYSPEVTTYKQEVNRIINEIYLDTFASRPWEFAQKTIDLYTYPDKTDTEAEITPSGTAGRFPVNQINNVSADFYDLVKGYTRIEGSILKITGATDNQNNGLFMIDKADDGAGTLKVSRLSNTPRVDWEGTASVAQAISIQSQQRYLTLPADCVDVLSVGIRNIEEAGVGTNALGHFYSLSRKKDEELDLRLDLEGTPTDFIMYDSYPEQILDVGHFTPRAGKDFSVTASAFAIDNFPPGTYNIKMAYEWRGQIGQLSDAFAITVAPNERITITTRDTTAFGVDGLRKVFFIQLNGVTIGGLSQTEDFYRDVKGVQIQDLGTTQGFNYFVIDDVDTSTVFPADTFGGGGINALASAPDKLLFMPRADTQYRNAQRMRLFPRPTSQTPIRIRYMYVPTLLEDDFDVPDMPSDTHRYLVYRACEEVFFKHGNEGQSDYYRRKADREYEKISARYLTQRSALYVKGSYRGGELRPRPFRNLTHLG